jgi:sarcosine oxidase
MLEQYRLGAGKGASADHSRVIRHAYSRRDYTALTPAAYQSWGVAEQATGLQLVHRTGGLLIAHGGTAGAAALDQMAAAMDVEHLPYEEFTSAQVVERWPQWRLDDRRVALFDPEAGILDIRAGTAAHIALARDNGATVTPDAPVSTITEAPGGVTVIADGVDYAADRVVLAGGAWNPTLLQMIDVELPITLTEEQVTYFATAKIRQFMPDRFPVYGVIDDDDLLYYGFPIYGEVATKVAVDSAGPEVTPETRTYRTDPERVRRVREFLERYLPDAAGPELYSRVCCYDFPPDRDFIVDYLPGHDRVILCAGAGHAGKFAALLGRIVSELVLDDASSFPIDAFRADRAALTGIGATPHRVNSM